MTTGALHDKYRPQDWGEVFGQDAAVRALSAEIERGGAQVFLLTGPSGCGKTTLARIAARVLGATTIEEPAAVKTGVEDMRRLLEICQFRPLDAQRRVVILDECHRLSGNAWDSLLIATESPPADTYFFFCTTNPAKVPRTMVTRCVEIRLREIRPEILRQLLDGVCTAEGIEIPEEVRDLVVREAGGSPRQMLTSLAACRAATTRAEAAEILRAPVETAESIELCRFLTRGGSWARAMEVVKSLGEDARAESVRILIMNYFGKVALGARSERDAESALAVLAAFSQPYSEAEGLGPLMLSLGQVLLRQ